MKILAFAGSLRRGSLNRMLLANAVEMLGDRAAVDHLDLRDVAMPLYDGDLEASGGLPPGAVALRDRISAADALLIASPEYNNSVPGTLKNAIDWVSRAKAQPFRGRAILLLSASPGPYGGVRSVMALRIIFATLGALVLPGAVSIAHADQAFDGDGKLKDPHQSGQVQKACDELLRVATALSR